ATGNYYYYPAVRLDGFGGMGVIAGVSSSDSNNNIYPSLIVTGQTTSDPVNSTQQLSYLKTGSQYEDDNLNLQGVTRYGDYFGAALDPSNSSKIWVGGEYNRLPPSHTNRPTWSTFIGSITLPYCKIPASGDWVMTSSCTLSSSSSAPANVIVQNNSLLTIPTGLSLNIDFTHYHLLVNYGSGVLIK